MHNVARIERRTRGVRAEGSAHTIRKDRGCTEPHTEADTYMVAHITLVHTSTCRCDTLVAWSSQVGATRGGCSSCSPQRGCGRGHEAVTMASYCYGHPGKRASRYYWGGVSYAGRLKSDIFG